MLITHSYTTDPRPSGIVDWRNVEIIQADFILQRCSAVSLSQENASLGLMSPSHLLYPSCWRNRLGRFECSDGQDRTKMAVVVNRDTGFRRAREGFQKLREGAA